MLYGTETHYIMLCTDTVYLQVESIISKFGSFMEFVDN